MITLILFDSAVLSCSVAFIACHVLLHFGPVISVRDDGQIAAEGPKPCVKVCQRWLRIALAFNHGRY